jgi:very-short-patch-repair endonuclease
MLRIDKYPMEIVNPKIGDIRIKIAPKGQPYKQIYYPCAICGTLRWGALKHGKIQSEICDTCSRKIRYTEVHKRNTSIGQKRNWQRKEVRLNHLIASKNPDVIKKRSDSLSKAYNGNNNMKKGLQSRWLDPNAKEKASKTQKKLWENPEHKNRQMDAMAKGSANAHPNKPETIILNILNTYFLNGWAYTGTGIYRVGDLKPDFVHKTNKWIIEYFGYFIHTKRVKRETDTEAGRIKYLTNKGYKTLILWEHDVKKLPHIEIAKKISEYFNTPLLSA